MRNNCRTNPLARRLKPPTWAWLGLPWALLIGCSAPKHLTLTDSEHRQFSASCEKGAPCKLSRAKDPTASAGALPEPVANSTATLRSVGRVVGLCVSAQVSRGAELIDCRPLVCQNDDECPPAEGLTRGVCINHLCTEPSHAVGVEDAVLLCLAGTGSGPKTPKQVERFALGYNCGSPCVIPKVCQQL